MITHSQIKRLISAYIDGEGTQYEKDLVVKHVKKCKSCEKYLQELKNISTSLRQWKDQDLSPDLEQKIHLTLLSNKEKEGEKMKRKRQLVPLVCTIATVLICFVLTQRYVSRQIQGRLRPVTPKAQYQQIAKAPLEGPGSPLPNQRSEKEKDPQYQQVAKVSAKSITKPSVFGLTKGSQKPDSIKYDPYFSDTSYTGKDPQYQQIAKALVKEEYMITMEQGFWGAGGEEIEMERYRGGLPIEDYRIQQEEFTTEEYDRIYENRFLAVKDNPLSTFSIDVDTASYSNVRRFLNMGERPPKDAVRIEELINYFTYDYPQPEGDVPFSITTEVASCPWNSKHHLAMIGLQGKKIKAETLPPSNLVFLLDVSGSMDDPQKLPLLKAAFRLLVDQLSQKDRVSIVVYAGASGLVLDPTSGNQKEKILSAIEKLEAGGTTVGGAGIKLAYKIAKENYVQNGNNRVILATDGDFNVGISSDAELVRLIENKRKEGIFLTVLGFGTGNYKDSKMEKLANKGNGNYFYVDSLKEAKKVLVNELGATLFTIAKDVKIQIEFNPTTVKAYRLIGYENRILAKEDFNDDTKDAGELGAGHSVTAFYELVSVDSEEGFAKVDPLIYQETTIRQSDDLMTVKLRYKNPDADVSQLLSEKITSQEILQNPQSNNFIFGSAVAEFGLLLRDSKHKADASYLHAIEQAKSAKGEDLEGYRAEFIRLLERAGLLDMIESEE